MRTDLVDERMHELICGLLEAVGQGEPGAVAAALDAVDDLPAPRETHPYLKHVIVALALQGVMGASTQAWTEGRTLDETAVTAAAARMQADYARATGDMADVSPEEFKDLLRWGTGSASGEMYLGMSWEDALFSSSLPPNLTRGLVILAVAALHVLSQEWVDDRAAVGTASWESHLAIAEAHLNSNGVGIAYPFS